MAARRRLAGLGSAPAARARRLAMECSGACGDLGTFIPHVIGAMDALSGKDQRIVLLRRGLDGWHVEGEIPVHLASDTQPRSDRVLGVLGNT